MIQTWPVPGFGAAQREAGSRTILTNWTSRLQHYERISLAVFRLNVAGSGDCDQRRVESTQVNMTRLGKHPPLRPLTRPLILEFHAERQMYGRAGSALLRARVLRYSPAVSAGPAPRGCIKIAKSLEIPQIAGRKFLNSG